MLTENEIIDSFKNRSSFNSYPRLLILAKNYSWQIGCHGNKVTSISNSDELENFANTYLRKVTKFQGDGFFRFGILSNLLAWRMNQAIIDSQKI